MSPKAIWLLIVLIFCSCVVVVLVGIFHPEGSSQVLQLLIFSGIVVGFIDRYVKQESMVKKIDQNTKETRDTAEAVAHKVEDTAHALAKKTERDTEGMIDFFAKRAQVSAQKKGVIHETDRLEPTEKDEASFGNH